MIKFKGQNIFFHLKRLIPLSFHSYENGNQTIVFLLSLASIKKNKTPIWGLFFLNWRLLHCFLNHILPGLFIVNIPFKAVNDQRFIDDKMNILPLI